MKRITRTFLAVTATAAVAVLSASAALADPPQGHRAPEGDDVFIPGVTDFPARPAVFIPGVTDFPARPAVNPVTVSVPRADGFDWSDAGIAAGLVVLSMILVTAAVLALRRRSKAILGTAVLGVAVIAASVGGAISYNHNETVVRAGS